MESLIEALNDCQDRLAAGESLENCLRLYPQHADQLRPLLESALLVRRAAYQPSEVRQAQDRVRLKLERRLQEQRLSRRRFRRRSVGMVAAVILVIGFVLAVVNASAKNALPGDQLYGVKRLTEGARLLVSADDETLRAEHAHRRISEIKQLLALRRPAEVTFEGTIQQINDSEWQVDELALQIPPTLLASDNIHVGMRVEVRANTTSDGRLIASAIRPLDDILIEPLQTPTPIPTIPVTPTQTPSPAVTFSPTPSQTPSQTLTPTLTPGPSRTPSPTNTSTACVPAPPEGWILYTTQDGDTLVQLAMERSITVDQVRQVNCLAIGHIFTVGETIYLPGQPQISPAADNIPSSQGGSQITSPNTPPPSALETPAPLPTSGDDEPPDSSGEDGRDDDSSSGDDGNSSGGEDSGGSDEDGGEDDSGEDDEDGEDDNDDSGEDDP